jgi:hypothetical protein
VPEFGAYGSGAGTNKKEKNLSQPSRKKQRNLKNVSGAELVNLAARCVRAHRAYVELDRDGDAMAAYVMDDVIQDTAFYDKNDKNNDKNIDNNDNNDNSAVAGALTIPHEIAESICASLFPNDSSTRSRVRAEMYSALEMYAHIAPPPGLPKHPSLPNHGDDHQVRVLMMRKFTNNFENVYHIYIFTVNLPAFIGEFTTYHSLTFLC